MLPRRFALIRHIDYTGVSGIGVVAYGVAFADGQVVLRWCSNHPATSMWSSLDDMLAVHGHGEATSVAWIDAPHGELEGFPSTGSGRRGRRRREDRAANPGTGSADDEKAPDSAELPRRPVDSDSSPVPAPAGSGIAHDTGPAAAADRAENLTDEPVTDEAAGAADGRPHRSTEATADSLGTNSADGSGPDSANRSTDPSRPDSADRSGEDSADGSREGPEHQRSDSPSTHRDQQASDAVPSAPTQRRDRAFLRPVRSDSEPSSAPLLTSTEHRNGHLYIDTAPLLLVFGDSDDGPAQAGSRVRRAGRHRRADPDAAG
ncbi:MAG TPA: hypothetical protein VFY84_16275 [Jiangellales bacterium]|nr:hypothetical protein [Jiangellales bacterium]